MDVTHCHVQKGLGLVAMWPPPPPVYEQRRGWDWQVASVRRMYVLQALGETEPGEQAGGPADATPLALPLTWADSEVSLPRAAIVRGVGGREPLYPSLPQFTNTADRIECP